MFNKKILSITLMATALIFSACEDDDDDEVTPTSTTNPNNNPQVQMIEITDQSVDMNTIVISEVYLDTPGWAVIHADDGSNGPVTPGIISVPKMVTAGSTNDVELTFASTANISTGDKVWVMMHTDDGDGVYEFDGSSGVDNPITVDGNVLMEQISINQDESISISNQTTSRNTINVSNLTVDQESWVVVHRDNGNNGPVVPEIISEPTLVSASSTNDVKVEITESISDGDKVWVMVHVDDGDGSYEFDTDQTVDVPVTVEGDILMKSIEISSPKIVANDQVISNNQIIIDSVEAAVDGWLVIHHYNNNSNDPQYLAGLSVEPIAGKVQVSAGVNTNVTINLSSDSTYSAGYKLYPMLHVNGDGDQNYDFPDGADLPEIFSNAAFPGNVILTEVTAQ
jgi:hypothetical protein